MSKKANHDPWPGNILSGHGWTQLTHPSMEGAFCKHPTFPRLHPMFNRPIASSHGKRQKMAPSMAKSSKLQRLAPPMPPVPSWMFASPAKKLSVDSYVSEQGSWNIMNGSNP